MTAIDLLPVEYRAAKRLQRLSRYVSIGVAGLGVAVVAVTAVTFIQVSTARAHLDELKSTRTAVKTKVGALAHIAGLDTSIKARQGQLATALAGELAWPQIMSSLKASIPEGTKLTTLASAGSAGTTTFSVTGSTQKLDGLAAWLSSVEGVAGIVSIHPSNAVRVGTTDEVNFSASAQFVGPLSGRCASNKVCP